MPRITSGKIRNFKLKVEPNSTRPMTDRIKISLFDTLAPVLENAKVLDLYAGSGGVGLEALSRGAKHATFVENDYSVLKILNENISKSGLVSQSSIVESDVETYLERALYKYDLIFIDPPFPNSDKSSLLKNLHKSLAEEGIVVFRVPKKESLELKNSDFEVLREKKYGISRVYILQKK